MGGCAKGRLGYNYSPIKLSDTYKRMSGVHTRYKYYPCFINMVLTIEITYGLAKSTLVRLNHQGDLGHKALRILNQCLL